jgi:hypothetical protein
MVGSLGNAEVWDVKGRGRGVISDNFLAFAWNEWSIWIWTQDYKSSKQGIVHVRRQAIVEEELKLEP